MKPAGVLEGSLPIDVARFGDRDGRAGAVIDDLRGTLIGPGLEVVNAEPAFAANDSRCVHTEAPQLGDRGVSDGIFREDGSIDRVHPELRQRDRDICFAAAEGRDKLRALQKSLQTWRRQPQHDLTKSNDRFAHSRTDIVRRFAGCRRILAMEQPGLVSASWAAFCLNPGFLSLGRTSRSGGYHAARVSGDGRDSVGAPLTQMKREASRVEPTGIRG